MKTLHIIFGAGAATVLLGLNVALADMKHELTRVPLTFSLDFGDSSVILPDLTFDTLDGAGGEEAQTTCAMTPGGTTSAGLLIQTPIVPLVNNRPEDYGRGSPQTSLPPVYSSSQPYSPNSRNSRNRNNTPLMSMNPSMGVDPENSTATVPEPATLVIVGLGIGAVAVARRRWKNR